MIAVQMNGQDFKENTPILESSPVEWANVHHEWLWVEKLPLDIAIAEKI